MRLLCLPQSWFKKWLLESENAMCCQKMIDESKAKLKHFSKGPGRKDAFGAKIGRCYCNSVLLNQKISYTTILVLNIYLLLVHKFFSKIIHLLTTIYYNCSVKQCLTIFCHQWYALLWVHWRSSQPQVLLLPAMTWIAVLSL